MMRIICGTDFSEAAAHAVRSAAALSRRSGDALELVCATGARLHAAAFPDTSQGIVAPAVAHAEQLGAEVARLRSAGVTVVGELDPATAEEALVARARNDDVRLLVIGAVGHSLVQRLLVGSVAERVAMRSPAPVVVVRESEGWRAWQEGSRPLRVVVAFDPGASARRALAWSAWLAALGDVQLTACWVVHPGLENEQAGVTGAGAGIELLPATRTAVETEFTALAQEVLPPGVAELHLEVNLGRVDSALIHFARTREADLLVVGSHQRHGFERLWEGSVSRGVLHHAPMNVAVVPLVLPEEP